MRLSLKVYTENCSLRRLKTQARVCVRARTEVCVYEYMCDLIIPGLIDLPSEGSFLQYVNTGLRGSFLLCPSLSCGVVFFFFFQVFSD